ncbi:MAG: RNA-binding protein [Verrucomicrobiota bacterium]
MNPLLFKSNSGHLPAANTVNEAGGRAYALGPKLTLAQYAATGCLNGTFYASAETQLDTLLKMAAACDAAFVAKTAVFARQRGFMKDGPALLAAHLAQRDPVLLRQVFDRVIDDGKMLRNFVQIVRSGVTGRKSLGTAPKRLVQRWLTARTDDQLFRASVGQKPSLADVVKMVHPKPNSPQRQALYGWLCSRKVEAQLLPPLVQAFEAFKEAREANAVPDVPFQMLTALDLCPAHWAQIARTASWQTTRMNLNTFARHGVFAGPGMARLIAERLRDPDKVRKARVFPYQLMAAYANVSVDVPGEVKEALQDAMETATQNVPSIAGKVWILPDVSGSMQSPVTGYRPGSTTAVRCLDVAALVTACFLRNNRGAEVLPFTDRLVPVVLNPRDTVLTNAAKLAALPPGATDCSVPLAEMNRRKAKGDLVLIVSDNESWAGRQTGPATALMVQWEAFRKRNPGAKLVCLDIQPHASSQAPERADVMNIGGFSDSVFEVIAAFADGTLRADHWVGVIEKTVL